MKIRMRFMKTGDVRYVGHLDFMRTFQKTLKRSGFDMAYTRGFNPHMILSFAVPLGVGEESLSEYVDADFAWRDPVELDLHERDRLNDLGLVEEELPVPPHSADLVAAFNANAPAGVRMISAGRISPLKSANCMSRVRFADHIIFIKNDAEGVPATEEAAKVIADFMANESVIIRKKTKSGEKDTDIRPMIKEFGLYEGELPEEIADIYGSHLKLFLRCSQGSTENLKPSYALEALSEMSGIPGFRDGAKVMRSDLLDADMRSLSLEGTDF